MQNAFRAAATAALLLTAVQPAHGQGFLGRLAERARQKVEEQAEQIVSGAVGAGQGATAGSSKGMSSSSSSAPAVMTPKAVRGAAPRATPAATEGQAAPVTAEIKFPSRMPPPAGFAAVKAAYDEFGKVKCFGCEGGYAYDGWPSFPRDEHSGKYNGSDSRLGAMKLGQVHSWKGAESTGTLTVVREETVGGFRCRHLLYRLTKGIASAERPGLICWGYSNEYASSEGWNQVY